MTGGSNRHGPPPEMDYEVFQSGHRRFTHPQISGAISFKV